MDGMEKNAQKLSLIDLYFEAARKVTELKHWRHDFWKKLLYFIKRGKSITKMLFIYLLALRNAVPLGSRLRGHQWV